MRVYIDGSVGTTGLALEGRLLGLDYVEIIKPDGRLRKDLATRRKYLNAADVAFLCLPDDAAIEAVAMVDNPTTVVIDASTAHRTTKGWAYGFPELSKQHREAIKSANHISVPGCHASGFSALVFPAIKAGYIDANSPVFCQSLTGYSGGGNQMIAEYEDGSVKQSAAKLYSLQLAHKHLPEMQHVCGLANPPVFTPILVNARQGMVTYIQTTGYPAKEIWEYFNEYYASERLIKIMALNAASSLELEGMNDMEGMEIYICGNDSQAVLAARFDNLGKGSSGAAVECMKVRMGYE